MSLSLRPTSRPGRRPLPGLDRSPRTRQTTKTCSSPMLSTKIRLKVEFLCSRIEKGAPVGLEDMVWLNKWATSNRSVHNMVSRARRRAVNGLPEEGSLDELLDGLNLGEPDPAAHITGESSVDQIADFFHAPDWMRRD